MTEYTSEVVELARGLMDASLKTLNYKLMPHEALQIATQVQRNRILATAYVVDGAVQSTPVALEKMAMEIGSLAHVIDVK